MHFRHMNVLISKIGHDCRDADFASINAWEACCSSIPALFYVGVVYPSNERFVEDLKSFSKIPPEYLVDFLIVTSSGYPIAWKLGSETSFPTQDIGWITGIKESNKSDYIKIVNEFIQNYYPEIKEPVFVALQDYFDRKFEKKIELIVPDFNVINDELVKYLAKNPEYLPHLHWRKFEELVCLLFKNIGYETFLGPGRGDMGVDLRLIKKTDIGELLVLVQAKKYAPENRISLAPVQALYGAVNKEEASKGILVSTSEFEPVAKRFANSSLYRIELAGPDTIRKWLESF